MLKNRTVVKFNAIPTLCFEVCKTYLFPFSGFTNKIIKIYCKAFNTLSNTSQVLKQVFIRQTAVR